MTERFLSSSTTELEFTKKHIASLSGVPGGVQYNRDFALQPEERERKVPISQVVLARPPEPIAESSTSTSTTGALSNSDSPSISLTVKSLKPPLSFTLTCSLTATIATLKEQLYTLHKAKGAPAADRQRWLYKGKAMADERLLKEYDGLKDGETVHLSMKAAQPAASTASIASADDIGLPAVSSTSIATPSTTVSSPKDKLPSLNTSSSASGSTAPPKPFSFTSSTLSTDMPSPSRGRTTSTSSLSSSRNGAGAHSRVPSITLTTDIVNFSNLSGNAPSPIEESLSPGNVSASTNGSAVPAYSPPISGASTPRSAPGTPVSGPMSRTKSPSISIPIDLDNIELMNPVKSDRRGSIGLSPKFTNVMKDPQTWLDVLDFLDSKFRAEGAPRKRSDEEDYMEDSKRAFETWLGASKEFMTASDIARVRDTTGVWAMAGR